MVATLYIPTQCTRACIQSDCSPASQWQRPPLQVPRPLQSVGSPGQLASATCCSRLATNSGCFCGSSLVVSNVDLMLRMHNSPRSSATPSNEPAMLSINYNERHNSQIATISVHARFRLVCKWAKNCEISLLISQATRKTETSIKACTV